MSTGGRDLADLLEPHQGRDLADLHDRLMREQARVVAGSAERRDEHSYFRLTRARGSGGWQRSIETYSENEQGSPRCHVIYRHHADDNTWTKHNELPPHNEFPVDDNELLDLYQTLTDPIEFVPVEGATRYPADE